MKVRSAGVLLAMILGGAEHVLGGAVGVEVGLLHVVARHVPAQQPGHQAVEPDPAAQLQGLPCRGELQEEPILPPVESPSASSIAALSTAAIVAPIIPTSLLLLLLLLPLLLLLLPLLLLSLLLLVPIMVLRWLITIRILLLLLLSIIITTMLLLRWMTLLLLMRWLLVILIVLLVSIVIVGLRRCGLRSRRWWRQPSYWRGRWRWGRETSHRRRRCPSRGGWRKTWWRRNR